MRWSISVLLIALLMLSTGVSALEVEYTLSGGLGESFTAHTMTLGKEGVLIAGQYTKYSGGKSESFMAIVRTEGRENFEGKLVSFLFKGSPVDLEALEGKFHVLPPDSGGYYLLGTTSEGRLLVVRTNEDFSTIWGEEIELFKDGKHRDAYLAYALLDNGYLYVLARTKMEAGKDRTPTIKTLILKLSPEGELLWARVLTVKFLSFIPGRIVIQGDKIYVVGTSSKTALGGARVVLMKLLTNGSVLGAFSYSLPPGVDLMGSDVLLDKDGLYILGMAVESVNEETVKYPVLLKIMENGTLIWAKKLNTPGLVSNRIAPARNGLYLAGVGSGLWGAKDLDRHVIVARINENGNVEWAKTYEVRSLSGLALLGISKNRDLYGAVWFYNTKSGFVFMLPENGEENCWDDLEITSSGVELDAHPVDEKNLVVYIPETRVHKGVSTEVSELGVRGSVLCGASEETTTFTTSMSTPSSSSTTSSTHTSSSPATTSEEWSKKESTTTEKTNTKPPSSSKSSGICGPGVFLSLALLPALLRRR